MAKNRNMKRHEEEDEPFSFEPSMPESMMNEMVGHFFEVGRQHLEAALVLTKLIIDKTEKTTKEEVFSVFKESLTILEKAASAERMLAKLNS